MSTIKTAISLNDIIYKEISILAKKLKVPKSQLFALAAEEFLQRHKNEDLIHKINDALGQQSSREDKTRLVAIKRKHRKLVEGQW